MLQHICYPYGKQRLFFKDNLSSLHSPNPIINAYARPISSVSSVLESYIEVLTKNMARLQTPDWVVITILSMIHDMISFMEYFFPLLSELD